MATLNLLILTMMVTGCIAPVSAYKIHGVDLARRLIELSRDGLGQEKIQDLFDSKASFATSLPIGEEIVQSLATSLGNRFDLYSEAIKNLRQSIVDNYAGFSENKSSVQECCKVQDSSLRYNRILKAEVDIDSSCYRLARTSTERGINAHIPEVVMNRLKENLESNKNIGWQYFGNEEGLFLTYPSRRSSNCSHYDNRLRPWYAEANAPIPKDIVIVFEDTGQSINSLIKQAVWLLLDTTNPNDKITVIKFGEDVLPYLGSTDISPCFSNNLALATPQNRKAFQAFVNEERQPNRNSIRYLPALERAFRFFKTANDKIDNSDRSKLLVFMTTQDPGDVQTAQEISNLIRDENNRLDNTVVVQTYSFGTQISDRTKTILREMSKMTKFTTHDGQQNSGTYTEVNNDNQLRVQLHSYYNIFGTSSKVDEPIVTVPYVDFSGLGLVVSLCLPVHTGGILRGVTCLDAKIEDIFFNVTYYEQGIDTYIFIIDSRGRTIQHPLLPKPTEVQEDPVFVDISTLERQSEVVSIIESMNRGGNGSKVLFTRRSSHDQGLYADGASFQTVISHYFWTKVPHTDFSLCVVLTDRDSQVQMNLNQRPSSVNYIHPYQLGRGGQTCLHRGTEATVDGSIVMFTGEAYKKLSEDINPNDPQQSQAYQNFFKANATDQGPGFKPSTNVWVALTGMVDKIWQDETSARYDGTILWRHLVTATGVLRLYPGTLFKRYDPRVLSWYKMATLNLGWILMRQVEGDDFNLIVSQSIFKGSRDGQHASTDIPVAVVSGEIKSTFVYNVLEEIYPECNGARCFVIDESGYILAHKHYSGTEHNASHIITLEPDIAKYLQDTGHLVKTSCLDFKKYVTLTSWKMSLRDWVVSSDSPRFELHTVYGTNVYVGISWEKDRSGTCDCGNITRCIPSNRPDECQCPCYEPLEFNFCNNTLPDSVPKETPTCSVQKQMFNILQPPPSSTDLTSLKPCFETSCGTTKVRSMCLARDECQWCVKDKVAGCHESSSSCEPYFLPNPCTSATLRSHCHDRTGCQWCQAEGDTDEGCHREDRTCSSGIVAIVVPIVLILLIVLLVIGAGCFLRKFYPDKLGEWCGTGSPCCVKSDEQKHRPGSHYNMGDISPSVTNLPRAPERPPGVADRNGNSYVEYQGDEPPTPPSMEGRARINRAFVQDDKSIYYEVSPGEERKQFAPNNYRSATLPDTARPPAMHDFTSKRANTLGGRVPSEEYLHPKASAQNTPQNSAPSSLQGGSISMGSDKGPYFRPAGQTSDYELDRSGAYLPMDSDDIKNSRPTTYNRLQSNAAGNMALSPVDENSVSGLGPENQYQNPQQQPQYNHNRHTPSGRKSNPPPAIPSFPRGHPYHHQNSSTTGPSSSDTPRSDSYQGSDHDEMPPPPSFVLSPSDHQQSEPYDLSYKGQDSQQNRMAPFARSDQLGPYDVGRPDFNPHHNAGGHRAMDLSKRPPERAHSQPVMTSEPQNDYRPSPPQSLPVTGSRPPLPRIHQRRPPNLEVANPHLQNHIYTNDEAQLHYEPDHQLDLSLELPNPYDIAGNHSINNNNNGIPGAHGEQPVSPEVVDPERFGHRSRMDDGEPQPPQFAYQPSTDSGVESESGRQGSSQTFAKYV